MDEGSSLAQQIIADCIRRRVAGEVLPDEQVVSAHPEMASELSTALRKLALVEQAVRLGLQTRNRPLDDRPRTPLSAPGSVWPACFPGYEVLGETHRGGQAVVYKAVQQSTRRRVAIKAIKEGPLAGHVDRVRFEREVQILAQLKHPNIVAIHDSGVAAGVFYYVMDYISGSPLDEYVGRSGTPFAERLRLFAKVCDAVNAAHLHGVIHRDLKPSNICVDADGEPHLLDFGLAKLAGTPDSQVMTETGQFFGSLPWASPEQAQAAPGRVDLRTDVYALGVILYHLLTGRFPYEVTGTVPEVITNILKSEPVRPSRFCPDIDDEIETIVLKCLNKDRERRYQGAGELARDIRHYLAGEPIEAKRESLGYVLRKQLHRYRVPAAVGAAFVIVMIAGLAVSLTFWARAVGERDRALAAEHAQIRERARAESVNAFLQEMLASVEPSRALGREVTVRQVLDEAARKLDSGALAAQPDVEAALHSTVGNTYRALGLFDAAEPHLRAALALNEEHPGVGSAALCASLNDLGMLLQAKGDYDGAEALARRALELQRAALGDTHPDVAATLSNLALALQAKGDYGAAEPLLRQSLEVHRRAWGVEHPATATSQNNLAMLLRARGDLAEAESLLRQVLTVRRKLLGHEHPLMVQTLNNLAVVLAEQGQYAAAEPLYREALDLRRRLLGAGHPDVATSLNNLAALLRRMGQYPEAETLYREALAIRRELLGEDHPDVAETLNNLGVLLRRQGRLEEAQTAYRESLAIWRRQLGANHPTVAVVLNNLGRLSEALGNLEEAEQLHREALAIRRAALGDNHLSVAESMNNLAAVLLAKGAAEEAEPLLVQALRIRRAALPPGNRDTLATLANLGEMLVAQQRYAEAEALLLEGYATMRDCPDTPPADLTRAVQNIIALYEAWGRSEEADEWRAQLPARSSPARPD